MEEQFQESELKYSVANAYGSPSVPP
jgi:hypothetical protein